MFFFLDFLSVLVSVYTGQLHHIRTLTERDGWIVWEEDGSLVNAVIFALRRSGCVNTLRTAARPASSINITFKSQHLLLEQKIQSLSLYVACLSPNATCSFKIRLAYCCAEVQPQS